MRADRLVSLVLLLRQRGLQTATELAVELEVSTRTVLRDIESLGAAGVPVYTERGRHGGFALLPGFKTEPTGLNHDEALALLVAGSRRGAQAFGLGSALASAMRKVVDALPERQRASAATAAQRLLVDPDTDLLAQQVAEEVPDGVVSAIRHAVLAGHKLRIHYAAQNKTAQWRTVDPLGLVTVRDKSYLLALHSGAERTYRLSRVLAIKELAEVAQRPTSIDLGRVWKERSTQLLTHGTPIAVTLRVDPSHQDPVLRHATVIQVDEPKPPSATETLTDDWPQLQVTFSDASYAEIALWQHAEHAEVLTPQWLRIALHARAAAIAKTYET